MIEVDKINEWCEDALTHGLYVSECEERYQAYYSGYLHKIKRDDLIDVFKCNSCLKCLVFCPWTQKYSKKYIKKPGMRFKIGPFKNKQSHHGH